MEIVALQRKVAWRILPLLFIIYVVCYLDRVNLGFAKLRMAGELRFSDEVFGLGIGVFFLGYLLLEVPGAILVERSSARKWFARILISWGLISALTAFVRTPGQFYFARFILGLAEAGFFPGAVVYTTHWFTAKYRARVLASLIMAVPVSLALGAPLSAWLLSANWLGLAGWQWLFIVEGLPAVALGLLTLRCMADRPKDAMWLSLTERQLLEDTLASEAAGRGMVAKPGLWSVLRQGNLSLLALGILATNLGGYSLVFWLPTILQNLAGHSENAALYYSGIFYTCGTVGMVSSGLLSDRFGQRRWHCVGGQVATGLLLALSARTDQAFALTLTWLCLTGIAAFYWPAPFWALPTLMFDRTSAPAAIGVISMTANLAGYLGNHAVGLLRTHGFGDKSCLLLFAICYALGGLLVAGTTRPERRLFRDRTEDAPGNGPRGHGHP